MKNPNYAGLFASSLIFLSCSNNEIGESPEIPGDRAEKLVIENNRISCDNCDGFGEIIEASDTQVFTGGGNKCWVFDYNSQGISAAQEIEISTSGYINSITVEGSLLLIGFAVDNGTGRVYQYSQNGGAWQYVNAFEIGRNEDNFGNDIAVDGSIWVVGASAPWQELPDLRNNDAGSIYIYNSDGSQGGSFTEFYAQESRADDRFGNDVLVWNNVVFACGLSEPLHIYLQDNDQWNLFSVENDKTPTDIANFNNVVLYYDELSGMSSFTINPDGSITDLTVSANLEVDGGIDFRKDNISMLQNYALFGTFSGQLFLLQLENNEWTLAKTLGQDLEEPIAEGASKLTAQYAFYSGYHSSSRTTAYMYFEGY